MKKKSVFLLFLLLSIQICSQSIIKFGPYAGFFSPEDENLKVIYTKGDLIYGFNAGVHIWNGFYIWLSGLQFRAISETTFTGDITRLTLNPLSFSVRYTYDITFINPYIELGYCYVLFKEEADMGSEIGNTSGKGNGYSISAGLEIKLSRHFIIDGGVTFRKVKVNIHKKDVELGGWQTGMALFIAL